MNYLSRIMLNNQKILSQNLKVCDVFLILKNTNFFKLKDIIDKRIKIF